MKKFGHEIMKLLFIPRQESIATKIIMKILLLVFITSALASSTEFLDVSNQFDSSLERMLTDLKGSNYETISIGTFPAGNTWLQNARMGNFSTIRRESQVSLMKMLGKQSAEGGLSLGDMFIIGKEDRTSNVTQQRIIVRENLWNYNFWINPESENCNDGVTVILTDIGQMSLILDNGEEQDETYSIKQHMDDSTWRRISGAMAEVFKNHFDFCNLLKN